MVSYPQNGAGRILIYLFIGAVYLVESCLSASIEIKPPDEILCSHQPPKPEDVIQDVHLQSNTLGHIQKRSSYESLRISLHYDITVYLLSSEHRNLVMSLVDEAVRYWKAALMVRRGVSNVRLNRQCSTLGVRYFSGDRYCVDGCSNVTKCGDIYIPESHLERCYYYDSPTGARRSSMEAGPGVDTDFILYVAATTTSRCGAGRTIAYAAHCQQEHLLDRPVAGYFTICPYSISSKTQDHLQLLSTIKHEILHALGFTAGLFAFYRDDTGQPYTPRFAESNKPPYNSHLGLYQWSEKIVKKYERPMWKTASGYVTHEVNLLVTPRVVQEVRDHFNCPTLEGAELENQGMFGTFLTHWEKRIFENEAMTGTYTQNPVISRITLALMEDTGWYTANYLYAEHLDWGKGLGCDFVKRSCLDWIDTQKRINGDIHPFCDNVRTGNLRTECTRNRDAVAFCNLQEFTGPLPSHYQYFSSLPGIHSSHVNRYGGSVSLADYCPYLQEFTWKDGTRTVRDSRCAMHENNPHPSINFYGEFYGQGSKCFDHYSAWRIQRCHLIYPVSHSGSGCYSYDCINHQGLILYVNSHSYSCLKAGQKIHISYVAYNYLHDGYVICPSCGEVCNYGGFVCPPEIEPYHIVDDTPQNVPCGAEKTKVVMVIYMLSLLVLSLNFHERNQ